MTIVLTRTIEHLGEKYVAHAVTELPDDAFGQPAFFHMGYDGLEKRDCQRLDTLTLGLAGALPIGTQIPKP